MSERGMLLGAAGESSKAAGNCRPATGMAMGGVALSGGACMNNELELIHQHTW